MTTLHPRSANPSGSVSGSSSVVPTLVPDTLTIAEATKQALLQVDQRSLEAASLAKQARDAVEKTSLVLQGENEERQRWLPWLATVLVLNIAVWLTTVFWICDADVEYTNRDLYETIGWVAILAGLSVSLLFLVWCPKPGWFQELRKEFAMSSFKKSAPFWVAIFNAFFCALAIVVYLRTDALHRYMEPVWTTQIVYNETLIPPGFSFLGGGSYRDDAMASFTGGGTTCTFPRYSSEGLTDCPEAFSDNQSTLHINSGMYGDLQAYTFDPRKLLPGLSSYTTLSDRLLLRVNMNYNKTALELAYGVAGLQMPFIFAVLYDPRIDLTSALRCGLIALTEIPALASNTFTIAAESTFDALSVVQAASTRNPECKNLYAETLSMTSPPYTSYSFNLVSLPFSDPDVCDSSTNPDGICSSQNLVRFGNRKLSIIQSKHGIGKIDILINQGAIVGAIQFFAWFVGIFTL